MRSRAQLREIDISSYLKVKKSAFSIAQRRRGFREVVTQAASAHAKNGRRGSPRHHVPSLSPLPSREERLYLPSITSSYRRRYVKVGRFGATGANNRRCSESEFSQDPKRTPNVLVEIDLPGHQYRRRHEGSGGSWHWKNSQMCSV